jgi:hypothetical protein
MAGTRRFLIGMMLLEAGLYGVSGCKGEKSPQAKGAPYAVDKVYERGPLTVHVRLDQAKVSIAQTLGLELEAQIQSGYKLTMPKIDKALENLGLADWESVPDRLGDQNRVIKTRRYRLEPFVSGKVQIPALTFQFQDANDPNKAYALDTEPLDVEVTSLLREDRAKLTIADIEGVVDPPEPRSWAWLWLTGILVMVGLGIGTWGLLRRRRATQVVRILRPAHEVAYDRLRALVEARLVEAGQVKEFYEAISNILRHYIEDRFSLHAPEQTTEEFLYTLAQTDALSPSDKAGLGEFLGHCDLVKFARHQPTPEQIQRTFDLVKGFIEKTRSDEHLLDVTDRAQDQKVEEGVTP